MALDESLLLDVENGSSGQEFMKAINGNLLEVIRLDGIKCELKSGSYTGNGTYNEDTGYTGKVTIPASKIPKLIFITSSSEGGEYGFGIFNEDTLECRFKINYSYKTQIATNTYTLWGSIQPKITYDKNTSSVILDTFAIGNLVCNKDGVTYHYCLIY